MVVTYAGWDDAKPVLPGKRSNGLHRPLFFPSAQADEAARLRTVPFARLRGWDEEAEVGAFQLGRMGARAGGDGGGATGRGRPPDYGAKCEARVVMSNTLQI